MLYFIKLNTIFIAMAVLFCAYSYADEIKWDKAKADKFADKFDAPNFIFEYTNNIYPKMTATKIVAEKGKNPKLIGAAILKYAGQPPKGDRRQYQNLLDPSDPSGAKKIGHKFVENIVLNHQNNMLIKNDPDRVQKIKSILDNTKAYNSAPDIAIKHEPTKITILPTVSSDIITRAMELNKEGKKVGVVVAADSENMGGGYTDGAGAMEESMMYSMPYLGPVLGALVKAGAGKDGKYFIPEFGAIVVDGAKALRRSALQDNLLIPEDEQFGLTAIFSAAPDLRFIFDNVKAENEAAIKASSEYQNLPEKDRGMYLINQIKAKVPAALDKYLAENPGYLKLLAEKIKTQLNSADEAGVQILLYPAWGMGVFGNRTSSIIDELKAAVKAFKGNNLTEIQFVTLPFEKDMFNQIETALK